MAYMHGVRVQENPTNVPTPVSNDAGVSVIFGTAPVNLASDPAEAVNKLFLCNTFAEAKAEIVEKKPEELVEEQAVPEMELTPEEQKMVDDFAGQIDLTNTQAVLQYGAGSQKKIADFSETALSNVRTKDMGEVGQLLTDVVAQLKDFDTEEDKGFFGLFKKSGDKLNNLKAKYDKAEVMWRYWTSCIS